MIFSRLKRRQLEIGILLVLAVITNLVFRLTDLDIQVAELFYHPENPVDPWLERHWWLWRLLFDDASPFILTIGISALVVYLLSFVVIWTQRFRRQALYVVLLIAIGPGLLVNLIFKDHWGRPRPVHITQFAGEYQYIPPLQIGHTPDKSFPCGHCSVAYSFFALYYLAQNYRIVYLLLTIVLAGIMGYSRMVAGGHFLSDVLWSGYLVFLVAYLLNYGWYARKTGNVTAS